MNLSEISSSVILYSFLICANSSSVIGLPSLTFIPSLGSHGRKAYSYSAILQVRLPPFV